MRLVVDQASHIHASGTLPRTLSMPRPSDVIAHQQILAARTKQLAPPYPLTHRIPALSICVYYPSPLLILGHERLVHILHRSRWHTMSSTCCASRRAQPTSHPNMKTCS